MKCIAASQNNETETKANKVGLHNTGFLPDIRYANTVC